LPLVTHNAGLVAVLSEFSRNVATTNIYINGNHSGSVDVFERAELQY